MILVTGGTGFIGSHTTRALVDLGQPCVVTQHRVARAPGILGDGVVVEQLDCADRAAFLALGARHEITGIVHLAAPPLERSDPIEGLWANTRVLLNAFHAAREWAVPRISFASTVGAYIGVEETPFREDVPVPMTTADPIPVFKKSAELFASLVDDSSDVEVVSLRIATVWGPLGDPKTPYFALPHLVHAAVRGVEGGPHPPAHADDATDLCYVKDVARGIALLQLAETLEHRTYNVADGRATSNREIAGAIERAVPTAHVDLPPGRSGPDTYLDISRLREATGYAPQYGVERGIADYVAWLREGHER